MLYHVRTQKFPVSRVLIALLTACLSVPLGLEQPFTMTAQAQDKPANSTREYQMQVEYTGNVTGLANSEAEEPQALPLNVKAQFAFSQETLDNRSAVRSYRRAKAEINLADNPSTNELASQNHKLSVRLASNQLTRPVQYLSAQGILKQAELDLLTVPADPISFPLLLSEQNGTAMKSLETGTEWRPSDTAVRALLAAENLIEHDVKITVKEANAQSIKLYLTGDAKAEIEGAVARYQLVGLALLDATTKQVRGFRLTLDEKRTASQLAPAFDGQVKVDVRLVTAEEARRIDAAEAAEARKGVNAPVRLLWSTDSEFELVYDPRWKLILSEPETVIMRYADQGNLLAQCSILQLPRRPVDRPLTLEDFRAEVQKLLTESPGAMLSAGTLSTRSGLQVHKIAVTGKQDDIQIDWLYYHVAHADGRRLAMIFTMEHEAALTFQGADEKLLEAIRFAAAKTAQAETEDEIK